MMKILLVILASLHAIYGFQVGTSHGIVKRSVVVTTLQMAKQHPADGAIHNNLHRREILSFLSTTTVAALFALTQPSLAQEEKGKIVVFGGSGYVGAHVDQLLANDGYQVVSVSRSSPSDQANKVKSILGTVPKMEFITLDASKDDLTGVLQGADAVVSCIGAMPGSSNQRDGNGAVNRIIADASKAAGIKRFVYISVASDLANGPAKFLLGDYFKGKAEAESAVIKDFASDARLVVKPAIIAGGPPGEIRPPGPPGMKPATVEAVAKVVVAGATGQQSGSIDGNDAIMAF
mmetsp:Transcript_16141/g.29176  ORF Transcript_16141/g.29176 Transcript_16141/m.29176 type:complete len:291 (+) Transcript_16141:11-883(+)